MKQKKFSDLGNINHQPKFDRMLSYRRETAVQGALQFSPNVEDWN